MDGELSPRDEQQVRAALAAVELADGVVPTEAFAALQTDALRGVVCQRLAGAGRVLVAREHRMVSGYVSGYDDRVADELVAEQIGVLAPLDRVVLAIVLLRTVAAPRASGRHRSASWMAEGAGTSVAELYANEELTGKPIRQSVRRLKARRLLREGAQRSILPGPALLRLTEERSAALWEDLVLVSKPDSLLASVIRARRADGRSGGARRYIREVEP